MVGKILNLVTQDLTTGSVGTAHRVACLDGIRGMAALLVAMDHMSCYGYHVLPNLNMAVAGGPPVAMFFVLSSFLLSIPFLNCRDEDFRNPQLWRNYAIRRFLRIYPLFFVVLLVFALRLTLGSTSLPVRQALDFIFEHLALLRGDDIFWAVHVEFKYYFLLPFVAAFWIFALRRNLILGLFVFCFILVSTYYFAPPETVPSPTRQLGVATYVSVFLMGFVCAILQTRLLAAGGIQSQAAQLFMEFLACLSMGVLILLIPVVWKNVVSASFSDMSLSWRWYLWGFVASLFLFSSLHGVGLMRSVFAWKPLRVLGLMSFSLYLWHYPVLWVLCKSHFPVGSTGLPVAALILFVSFVSYVVIERPFLTLGKRLCKTPREARASQPAT